MMGTIIDFQQARNRATRERIRLQRDAAPAPVSVPTGCLAPSVGYHVAEVIGAWLLVALVTLAMVIGLRP